MRSVVGAYLTAQGGAAIAAGPFFGTFLEHWPVSLAELSVPHAGIPMVEQDARALLALGGFGPPDWADDFSESLGHWLADALAGLAGGAFLRLGGRSFVHAGRGPQPTRTVQQAFTLLRNPGYRAARMAWRCHLSGRPIWLFAREWRDIAPCEEFRLFIRRRRLTGASQYHHQLLFPEVASRIDKIVLAIGDFAKRLSPLLHLGDVVADVVVQLRNTDPRVFFLELNPFMPVTGGALFAACSDDALDGTFRFRMEDGQIGSLALT